MLAAAGAPLHSSATARHAARHLRIGEHVGEERCKARVGNGWRKNAALQQLAAFPADGDSPGGAGRGIAGLFYETNVAELGEVLGGIAPAIARRGGGFLRVLATRVRSGAPLRDESAQLGDEGGDRCVLAHAR